MTIKRTIAGALGALVLVGGVGPSAVGDNRLPNKGHWDRANNEWPAHVTFVDYTGPAWPVGGASADWDVANRIDLDYLDAGGPGSCGHHCTPVHSTSPYDDPLGVLTVYCSNENGQIYGYFKGAVNANNHWVDSEDVIRYNRHCADRGDAFKRALTCQELGHGLGLDHANPTSSCMFPDPNYAASTPSDHDYFMLNQVIYDH